MWHNEATERLPRASVVLTDPSGTPAETVLEEAVVQVETLTLDALDLLEQQAGQLVVLRGRLDVAAAADVRLALAAAVDRGRAQLVLDLSGLEAVDATGLGVLVGAHRHAGRAGRTLVLRDPQPQIARLLLISRLDRVLTISRTAACV